MRELIEHIAKALVEKPVDVSVTEVPRENQAVLELRVAKEDLGRVIGKQGRTVRAMRTLLAAIATKQQKRVSLEIIE
ncbi:MAG: KH domain-containing protein [Deltaproteobacteria bacterium]|nr:KH domain-containing protein [Deltaproteobacteria bacterium]